MTNNTRGRPVRFFLVLMTGWVIIRVASAMFGGSAIAPLPPRPIPVAAARLAGPSPQKVVPITATPTPLLVINWPINKIRAVGPRRGVNPAFIPSFQGAMGKSEEGQASFDPEIEKTAQASTPSNFAQPAPPAWPLTPSGGAKVNRWRGSAWLLWRDGSANPQDLVTGGRLGGSQAGLRLDYDLTPASTGRAALYGRVSRAFNRPASPEAAAGIAWQPSRSIPISIAAERRISLGDGARNANAVFAVGGFGPTPVLGKLEAEAYGQAGLVGFNRRDLFADGKLSLLTPISGTPVRTGLSVSGGAQPQVERVDIGPEVQFRLPLPRVASRLSIEWRQRVAGEASPSSGLTLTLGADF